MTYMKQRFFLLLMASTVIMLLCGSCSSRTSRHSILGDAADDLKDYYDTGITDWKRSFFWFQVKKLFTTDTKELNGKNLTPLWSAEFAESDKGRGLQEKMARIVDDLKKKEGYLVGRTIQTEVAEGTPLKVIAPFKIIESSVNVNGTPIIRLLAEAEVEATTNIHVSDYGNSNYHIHVNYLKYDGSLTFSDRRCRISPVSYRMDIPAGTRFTLTEPIEEGLNAEESFFAYKSRLLDTQRFSLQWNPVDGNGSSNDNASDASNQNNPMGNTFEDEFEHAQGYDPGMEDDMEGYGTYGLMAALPVGTTVYTGDMGGYPIEFTIVNHPDKGELYATYKNVNYGTSMKMVGESLPADDGAISFFGEENGRQWCFNLDGDADNITGTASGSNNYQFKVNLKILKSH